MGVYGRARWATPQPFILEPVFVKNAQGKIEPRRMAWPAFWGTRDTANAAKIVPLLPATVASVCEGLLDVREQVGDALATLATDPNIPGTPVLAIDGKLFQKNVDGLAEPAGEASSMSGWFYQGPTNLIAAIPSYDVDANTEKMSEEQLTARQDSEKKLSNLLQTLDASKAAAKHGFGAVVIGSKLFFRGGENEAMITTNAPVKVSAPVVGWYKDGAFEDLISDYTSRNVMALGGSECTITEEMVATGLKRMAEKGQKGAVYVAHGQVWELDPDGKLNAKVEKAAEAVSWSVGHDVRPARMARGAKPAKCADCHTVGSKFFFAKVTSTGPLLTARTLVKAQNEFMNLSGSYNKVFGTTFLMRPFFKIFLWVVFAIMLLVAVAFVAAAMPTVLTKGEIPYGKPSEKMIVLIDKLAAVGLCAASVYLGLSGALGWFFHLMTGYLLVFHMVAGGLFATCLVALIWFRGARRITNVKRNVLWMFVMILGVLVLFTAVSPMMTWFGTGWQNVLLAAHRYTTFSFLAVSAWMLLTGGRKE